MTIGKSTCRKRFYQFESCHFGQATTTAKSRFLYHFCCRKVDFFYSTTIKCTTTGNATITLSSNGIEKKINVVVQTPKPEKIEDFMKPVEAAPSPKKTKAVKNKK